MHLDLGALFVSFTFGAASIFEPLLVIHFHKRRSRKALLHVEGHRAVEDRLAGNADIPNGRRIERAADRGVSKKLQGGAKINYFILSGPP